MSLQYLADFTSKGEPSENSVFSTIWSEGLVLASYSDASLKAFRPSDGQLLCRDLRVASVKRTVELEDLGKVPIRNLVNNLSYSESQGLALSNSVDGSLELWDLTHLARVGGTSTEARPIHLGAGQIAVAEYAEESEDQAMKEDSEDSKEDLVRGEELLASSLDSLPRVCSQDRTTSRVHRVPESWSTCIHPTRPIFASTGSGALVSLHHTGTSREGESKGFGELVRIFGPFDGDDDDEGVNAQRASDEDLFGLKVVFSLEGEMVAVGTNSGQVFVYDTDTGELLITYADHALPVRSLTFSEGHHLILGSDDKTITIHDVRDLRRIHSLQEGKRRRRRIGSTVANLRGHKGWILDLKTSSDGRILASSSTDKTIKLWDLKVNPKTCVFTFSETGNVWSISWKPRPSSAFLTGGDDGVIRWYRSGGVT
ncbi:WD40 repeat-like protein, partial [Violaceomyces palustris]